MAWNMFQTYLSARNVPYHILPLFIRLDWCYPNQVYFVRPSGGLRHLSAGFNGLGDVLGLHGPRTA